MNLRFCFPGKWLAALLASAGLCQADAVPSPGPDVREFWVPQQHLAEVLKASPKAVLLTAEQYATLWRDSRPRPAESPSPPPVPAVLRSARYHGTPGDRFITLRAQFSVECLTEEWTTVPLELNPRWLGNVTVDGETAVQATGAPDKEASSTLLVLHGRGPHDLTVDFALPVLDQAGRRSLELMAPGAVEATLTLTIPDKVRLESAEPFSQSGGEAVFALPPQRRLFRISWSKQDLAPLETAAVFQDCRIRYSINPARLEADLELAWHSPLRPLPPQVVLPLPAEVTVLGVAGPEVRQWTLAGDRLVVEFMAGERRDATLHLALEESLSFPASGGALRISLPAPVAEGVPRTSGQFSLYPSGNLRVRAVAAGTLAERDDARSPALPGTPAFGTWVFPVLPAAPEVEVEPLQVQFAATLDTQISLNREAVRLTRWVTLTPRDGTLFSPRLEGLMTGEEIESVKFPDGSEPAWQETKQGITFPDNKGIAAGATWTVVVASRLDPPGWQEMAEQPLALSLASARMPGAGKVNGYVALAFEDALLVATTTVTGLEPRDPRQFAGVLPLTGRMAWSRLEDYQLDLGVSRRAPEFDASVVLYAVPRLNSLEVEGALTLTIDRSPLKEVRVLFPAEAAASVRWDSPLLAESLLEAGHAWRLRFHQETDGAPSLRFRLSMPLTDATAAQPLPGAAAERRFKVAAPVPVLPGARRLHGAVMVEANTDTELTFAASGLNALDTLRVPELNGYVPRHRLVSAWSWLGGTPALTIEGVRHRPGELVSTVVDQLVLDTVISPDGLIRHQARMEVRTAGDQYLDVVLPEQARMLTLLVNQAPVKPVRNRGGGLRIPLSGPVAVIRLICECPGGPMSAAATQKLMPVTLNPALPVLDTRWQLHLPEGFSYSRFESNLSPVAGETGKQTPGVMALAWSELNPLNGLILSGKKAASASGSMETLEETPATEMPAGTLSGEADRKTDAFPPSSPPAALPPQAEAPAQPEAKFTDGAMQTRTFKVPPDFLSKGAAPEGSGLGKRPDARTVLEQLGVGFQEGAAATYSAAAGTLVVRNTPEQLAHAQSVMESVTRDGKTPDDDIKAIPDSDRRGILPLDFALPEGGRIYRFAGQYAPEALDFHYQSWERQMQWSWFWMVTGSGLFWAMARRHPWFYGISGLLLLQFGPGVAGRPEWLPVANALLVGWIAGAVCLGLLRTWRRQGRAPAPMPAGQTVLLLWGMLGLAGGKAPAGEPGVQPAPEVPVVVVPYDPDKPMDQELPDRRYLSYETFEKLWSAAKVNRALDAAKDAAVPAPGEPGSTLTHSLHRAEVDGQVLRVEAVFTLQTRGPEWAGVPFGLPHGLRRLTIDGVPAALKEGQLLVAHAGAHLVTAAYDVPLPTGWQEVSWEVPAATATSLALSLAMEDPARPVVNDGAPVVETTAAGRRVFTATLGHTGRIALKRQTTAERAGEQAAEPPLAKVRTRVYLTPALERIEASVAFTFTGQARRAFRLRMEAGLTPVHFSVPGLENWALRQEAGFQVLDLQLEREAREEFTISLLAERKVGALPLTENAPVILADAGRVEQEWSVLATDDLEVRPLAASGLQQVGFSRAEGSGDEGFDALGTWQATGTMQALRWELRPRVPEASAVVRYALQPGAGKLELSAGMELRPAPGRELRELTIRVPAGSTIQGVTGDRLADWWHEGSTLQVRFAAGAAEVTRLALNLTQPLAAELTEVRFAPLVIDGFPKVSGSGLLIAPVNQETTLRLAPERPSLREVAPQDTGSGFTIRRPFEEKRGFRFEGTEWTATASLKPLVARYDVDWVLDAEVRDTWVALNTRVLVSLTRGGLDRIIFTTPAGAPEFRITGDDVRETVQVVEGNERRYTVSFQALMTGPVLFTLTAQLPLSGSAGLPDFDFPGAARAARFVIVNNKSEGELKLQAAGLEITPREQVSFLPEELASGQAGARFYQARPGWSMNLTVEQLESTAIQSALILHADLTTSLLHNGDVWQQAVYVVQNRSLQFLPVHLPAGAELVSVAVGGEATRADEGVADGLPVLLVPLIQTAAGERATEVKLIYRRRGRPGAFPALLEDPDLPGLSVGQTFWTVQYPDGYSLEADGGNMTRTDDSGLASEKALSRLSELVSLRSIASSDHYDSQTRQTALRNAQTIASSYQSVLKDRMAGELGQVVSALQLEALPPETAQGEKPDEALKGGLEVRAKRFSFNKTTQAQLESLTQAQAAGKTDDLTLNDNVAWSFRSDPAGAQPVANRRLSQIDKLERGVRREEAQQLLNGPNQGEKASGPGDLPPGPAGTSQQSEFSKQNRDYSFRNGRLNQMTQLPQSGPLPSVTGGAAATSPVPALTGATVPPAPAGATAPSVKNETSEAGQKVPGDTPESPQPRLRTSGRSSLGAVFPGQKNALHFKKVKGDATLQIHLSKSILARMDRVAAVKLAALLGGVMLLRWLHQWFRKRRQTWGALSHDPAV